jgi:hypothetical protein
VIDKKKNYGKFHLFVNFVPASFILNFTRGLLDREMRSVSSARDAGCGSDPSALCVPELTTETFHDFITQPKVGSLFHIAL